MYPPVDTDFYTPDPARRPEPFFLAVSALAPYKRLDIAIRAVADIGGALTLVGRGPEESRLRRLAEVTGANVEFAGWLNNDEIRGLFRRARAVLMPGVEDFGMVPVEAQACGRPVVALAKGGALESVVDDVTGILVQEPTVEAFAAGLRDVSSREFDPVAIRRHAESFGKKRFQAEFQRVIDSETRRPGEESREVGGRRSDDPAGRSTAARYAQERPDPAARENEQ